MLSSIRTLINELKGAIYAVALGFIAYGTVNIHHGFSTYDSFVVAFFVAIATLAIWDISEKITAARNEMRRIGEAVNEIRYTDVAYLLDQVETIREDRTTEQIEELRAQLTALIEKFDGGEISN
jgi:hypothetical protein